MQVLAEQVKLERSHGRVGLRQRSQIELGHPVEHGPVIGCLAVVGQGRVELGKGMGVHLVHDRAGGQPSVDDVHRRVRKVPRNVLAVGLPAAGVFAAGEDRHLLLLTLHVVLPGDASRQAIDIFILRLLQKGLDCLR